MPNPGRRRRRRAQAAPSPQQSSQPRAGPNPSARSRTAKPASRSNVFVALEQMLVRAAMSPDFATTGLQALRNQCKGRRLKLKVKDPPRQLVVADLFWSPFHFDVIPADLAAAPQLPQLVLELMRYVLMRLGGSYRCVTRYTGGPSHFSYIIHLRFHNPPQDAFGTLTPTRRIVEIVLLKLRARDVPGLLADLRAANLAIRSPTLSSFAGAAPFPYRYSIR